MLLKEKTAIVTGGGSGIGLAPRWGWLVRAPTSLFFTPMRRQRSKRSRTWPHRGAKPPPFTVECPGKKKCVQPSRKRLPDLETSTSCSTTRVLPSVIPWPHRMKQVGAPAWP
jgi:hypothetical protein